MTKRTETNRSIPRRSRTLGHDNAQKYGLLGGRGIRGWRGNVVTLGTAARVNGVSDNFYRMNRKERRIVAKQHYRNDV